MISVSNLFPHCHVNCFLWLNHSCKCEKEHVLVWFFDGLVNSLTFKPAVAKWLGWSVCQNSMRALNLKNCTAYFLLWKWFSSFYPLRTTLLSLLEQWDVGVTEDQDERGDKGVQIQRDQTSAGLHWAGGRKHHTAEAGLNTETKPGQFEDWLWLLSTQSTLSNSLSCICCTVESQS